MLQYQGPAMILCAKQRRTQQAPPSVKASEIVITVAAARHARELQLRHEGQSATALEKSLDAQHDSPKSACAFCAE